MNSHFKKKIGISCIGYTVIRMMWEGGGVKTRSKMGVENDLMTTNGGLGKIGAATWTLVKRASEGQIHR